MKHRLAIQIRPLIWFITPIKKTEIRTVKYCWLCLELTIYEPIKF